MTHKELLCIYEPLHDESDLLARQYGLETAVYAGRAACLLNRASEAGIRTGSTLVAGNRAFQLPRLGSEHYDDRHGDQLHLDTEFATEQCWQDFKDHAHHQGITPHERMNRALRFTQYILRIADLRTPLTFYDPQTQTILQTVM